MPKLYNLKHDDSCNTLKPKDIAINLGLDHADIHDLLGEKWCMWHYHHGPAILILIAACYNDAFPEKEVMDNYRKQGIVFKIPIEFEDLIRLHDKTIEYLSFKITYQDKAAYDLYISRYAQGYPAKVDSLTQQVKDRSSYQNAKKLV